MPRAVIFGDLHLEAASQLGEPDPEYGTTRLRDARRILEQIAEEPADLLVFLGDLAGRKVPYRPSAAAYQVAQAALADAKAERLLALIGNHDWQFETATPLDVIAGVVPKFRVAREPNLTDAGGIQVGVLPWTPPGRMFAQAPHNPREMHRLVGGKLIDAARMMGSRLDPSRPSLLVGHWAIMNGAGEGASIVSDTEVILDADELAATGNWDVVAFGHFHKWEVLRYPREDSPGGLVCHVGPPMRGGFGEADVDIGYLVVEWTDRGAEVHHVATPDHRLVTVRLDSAAVANLIAGHVPYPVESIEGAIVKVQIECTDGQADDLRARGLIEHLVHAYTEFERVAKVLKPEIRKLRAKREKRSELTIDVDPLEAVEAWLTGQDVHDGPMRDAVLAEARRVIHRG